MMIILAVNIDKLCRTFPGAKKWMKRAILKKYMILF